jgi:hypothetical protein
VPCKSSVEFVHFSFDLDETFLHLSEDISDDIGLCQVSAETSEAIEKMGMLSVRCFGNFDVLG